MAFILAIDGPAGAGKSTVSRRVADALGFVLVDTGALYRTAGLIAARRGLTDPDELAAAVRAAEVRLEGSLVRLDGEDVSTLIRTPEASRQASVVSALPAVRAALLGLQRQEARRQPRGAVVEGRDIGTVVFPDAEAKVFLTASLEARALRRRAEVEQSGHAQSLAEVMADIAQRDQRDSQRDVAPLRAADDAVLVDTTGRTIEDVVASIVALVEARRGPA